MNKTLWKAYYRGYRTAVRHRRYVYYVNPFEHLSKEWYAFCAGFNHAKFGNHIR